MIFIDSNIPMYLVGADHPNKHQARRLLDKAVLDEETLVTDAEVYQELIHRYVAIDRRDALAPAFALLDQLVDLVGSIEHGDVHAARDLALRQPSLSARDVLHLAVMTRLGCRQIMSFDSGFDQTAGLTRIS